MRDNFIAQFLQMAGFVSAIAVAISQYIFRDNFRYLFPIDSPYYSIASLVALILSGVIITAIFANRYTLVNKYYFSSKRKNKYFKSLRPNVAPSEENPSTTTIVDPIAEPWHFSIKSLAIVSIFVAIASIILIINFGNPAITTICYIMFICSVVFSITVFATQLYLENDNKNQERIIQELILDKIKQYFAGEIRIRWISKDTSNWLSPTRYYWVERQGKLYKVSANAYDPNNSFFIEEILDYPPLNP